MNAGRRDGTSDQARQYRQRGHDAALEFAKCLDLDEDYKNDRKAKKDVVDPSGDAHSVKSGEKKWQIFLYGRNRFERDDGFQALNGVGSLLIHCIDAFPPKYKDYEDNKDAAKERLRTPMRELKDRFQRKALLRAFLMKSIFNGGEVDYLTIKRDDGNFHVYKNIDIVATLADSFIVENSALKGKGTKPEQKVLFKYKDRNVGELEMRNDSAQHYGEVRFNMSIQPFVQLLDDDPLQIFSDIKKHVPKVISHGKATKTFYRW
ncbi:MAG: hypothetical protein OXF49_03425 [Candidatus Saccharibacteria bacterium]|nr:hypothetical protein [Candidatus Saccharibacteria bacterium]